MESTLGRATMKFKRHYARLGASLLACLAAGGLPLASADEPDIGKTRLRAHVPSATARIVDYRIDKAPSDSKLETGDLHVFYSDGTEVVQNVEPRRAQAPGETVFSQRGFADVKVAADKRTIAWTETFENCCTSYAVPLTLAIYRSSDVVLRIRQGQMIWYWDFADDGARIAAAWGPTHGPRVADYQLYESATGRLISEFFGDEKLQALPRNAPAWAWQIEKKF